MTEMNAGNEIRPFVENLVCGVPQAHLNLLVVPLSGEPAGGIEYVLAADAIAEGKLSISEVSESGSVPELLVASSSDLPVLLVDGEELVGAKQNRILNTTILVKGHSQTKIPVSCVEQGRWHRTSSQFSSGGFSPSELRGRKSRSVSRHLRATGEARSDQGEVWDFVQMKLHQMDAASPTMSMHDGIEQRRTTIQDYVNAMVYPAGARGVIASIDGRFAAMDLFDRPETLARLWQRLMSGYALDAIGRPGAEPGAKAESSGGDEGDGAAKLLSHVAGITCAAFKSPGLGHDWRFESAEAVGQALVVDDGAVHLSAFPNSPDDAGFRASHIARPSQRRRHRRDNEGQ